MLFVCCKLLQLCVHLKSSVISINYPRCHPMFMISFFLLFFGVTLVSRCLLATDTPIIGILSLPCSSEPYNCEQPTNENITSYIGASYVQVTYFFWKKNNIQKYLISLCVFCLMFEKQYSGLRVAVAELFPYFKTQNTRMSKNLYPN